MADLVGIASIIGASGAFIGSTGGLWLAVSTYRTGRRRDDNRYDNRDDRPLDDLTDIEIAQELERRRHRDEHHGRRGAAEFADFLLRRRRPVTEP